MADKAGKPYAIASLVLGIAGLLFLGGSYASALSVIFGIAGVICSRSARREGYARGIYSAGRWLDVASIAAGLIVLVCSIIFKFSMISILVSIFSGL